MMSVNVPPTSTPTRALSLPFAMRYLRDMKSQIAARAYTSPWPDVKATVEAPTARIAPITRASVEQQVARSLRDMIVRGELPEGTPLVQRDLAERLGVSQTPVRVALGELERDGLAEVSETGRALVSRLTREDLEELYAARLGLEGLAARLGAAAVGEPELRAMRAILARLDRLAERRDVEPYLDDRWELHATCYRASGRTRLVAEVERLFRRGVRYHRIVLSDADRFARSIASYHDFVGGVRAARRRGRGARRRVEHALGGRRRRRLPPVRARGARRPERSGRPRRRSSRPAAIASGSCWVSSRRIPAPTCAARR